MANHNNSTSRRPRKRQRACANAYTNPHSGSNRSTNNQMQQQPTQSSAVRAIPGFVWDEEKRRYFPATSRAPDGMKERSAQRERKRVECIAEAQAKQRRQMAGQRVPAPLVLRQRSAHCRHSRAQPTSGYHFPDPSRVDESRLKFASIANRRSIDLPETRSPITALRAFATGSKGSVLIAGHRNGIVTQTSLALGDEVGYTSSWKADGEVTGIQEIANGRYIYTSMGDGQFGGRLSVFSLHGRHPLYEDSYAESSIFCTSKPAPGTPSKVAIGLTSSAAVAVATNCDVKTPFCAQTGTDIMSATFVDTPHVFAGGGRDGRIRLFDMRLHAAKHDKRRGLFSANECRHRSYVYAMGYCQGLLVSSGSDGRVKAWDIRMPRGWDSDMLYSQKRHSAIPGHRRPSVRLASELEGLQVSAAMACKSGFATCGNVVAAAGSDNQIRLWSLPTGRLVQVISLPAASGGCVALDLVESPMNAPTLYVGQPEAISAYAHESPMRVPE
ncbi:WD40 repeat-like protein [Martensiomyces pterosporus]|nr:WD40 repeat-like protein [Martensiomyces pterosporus]